MRNRWGWTHEIIGTVILILVVVNASPPASAQVRVTAPQVRQELKRPNLLGPYRTLLMKKGLVNVDLNKLSGFVDMHAHPMSRWAFGEELFWGENDGNPATALGTCHCFHRGYDFFDNQCGNSFRQGIVDHMDIAGHDTMGGAFPSFAAWPKRNAILHQQMWIDWIDRVREGGLRVMVALTHHSHALADGAECTGPNDDYRSMNVQIQKLKEFVGRHPSIMEIALSPADLRRIVKQSKLAVVIGVEMDNIGNFYQPADGKGGTYKPNPTDDEVNAEIRRLHGLGVRYIFPLHLTNNLFGGTALYQRAFNVSNKYNTGQPFTPEAVDSPTSGITFKLQHPLTVMPGEYSIGSAFMGDILPPHIMPNRVENYPSYPDPGLRKGHRNRLGLTDRGKSAIRSMMISGLMIDVDHMSEKAIQDLVSMMDAKGWTYPLNSGHNGPRGTNGTENGRTDAQYERIRVSGGMVGLGHGDEAGNFLLNFRRQLPRMGGRGVAIGVDANSPYPLPRPPASLQGRVQYGANLTMSTLGQRQWDYNSEGVAHYGLLVDYLQSVINMGMTTAEQTAFFSTAEDFARMWERCERERFAIAGPVKIRGL